MSLGGRSAAVSLYAHLVFNLGLDVERAGALGELVVEGEQVPDVGREVRNLRRRERALGPVVLLERFVVRDAELGAEEGREPGRLLPEESGGESRLRFSVGERALRRNPGEHNLQFIGPKAEHIRLMGDKIEAKKTATQTRHSRGARLRRRGRRSLDDAMAIANEIGFPVLVKAAAGGGGRGMKVAHTADDLALALSTAANEARSAFGDASVYLEKYLQKPRHIEIQVLGDGRGGAIHLGERDCSLQRRHQKVWEEGPSPALDAAARSRIGLTVAKAMQDLKYLGVGTVEFLYEDGEFYFIEMNTRIQVEHPVTEMITDIDLVLEQIRIAAGGELPCTQEDVAIIGHSIECRVNAENPTTFRPSPGKIKQYHPPGGLGVRINSAVYQGYTIPPYYDSLVGKLIVHGKTRSECLMRLRRALDEMVVDGIETTLPLFRALVREPAIIDGDYHIHWLEQYLAGQAGG